MVRRSQLALLAGTAVVVLLLSAVPGARAAVAPAQARTVQTVVHVSIQNFAYSPKTLTIAPGTTVVWTNKDAIAHTVTSDGASALLESDSLAQGKSYSHTFNRTGAYPYHCGFHPYMTAKIIVAGRAGTARPMAPSQPGKRVTVTIANFAYSPKTLTIRRGTTVVWTNKDAIAHTVTSDGASALLESDSLAQGKSYSHTFNRTGAYPYHCGFHPYMTAKIIVTMS